MPYPVSLTSILPGDQSFIVVATPGATSGAFRVNVEQGDWANDVAVSDYAASDSAWINKITNKYRGSYTCTVAEDVTALEGIIAMGNRFDVYVKRSSGATTYDKLANCILTGAPKTLPESGDSHRKFTLTFEGGIYTAGIAAASVPANT